MFKVHLTRQFSICVLLDGAFRTFFLLLQLRAHIYLELQENVDQCAAYSSSRVLEPEIAAWLLWYRDCANICCFAHILEITVM